MLRFNNRQRIPKWQSKMDNQEKLAKQDEEKKTKTKTKTAQYVLNTTKCK